MEEGGRRRGRRRAKVKKKSWSQIWEWGRKRGGNGRKERQKWKKVFFL